jgi:hypothetical protein
MRLCLSLLLFAAAAPPSGAAAFQEDFASDPAVRNWRVFGDTSLFHWNGDSQTLEVTWDSSKSNSFFHRPLGTILWKEDDFSLGFDLRLSDIAVGVNSNKTATFEFAIGFLEIATATKTNFLRGTGIDAATGPRNLVEFAYFPDSGFGATISPTMVSSNNQFAVGFNFPFELSPNDLFRVVMRYTGSNQTLATAMTRNGEAFGPIQDVKLGAAFTDFRVDALSISSYSDAGADGSLLAHGVVDNLSFTVPDPPIGDLNGAWTSGQRKVEFAGRAGWVYALERTENFQSWNEVASVITAMNGTVTLTDANPPAAKAFYRVRAERP